MPSDMTESTPGTKSVGVFVLTNGVVLVHAAASTSGNAFAAASIRSRSATRSAFVCIVPRSTRLTRSTRSTL
jgi:hypothetical protein